MTLARQCGPTVLAVLGLGLSVPTLVVRAQQPVSRARIYAQQLVDSAVARHPELRALELAVVSDNGCATVAATAPEDIGQKCNADENAPMQTGMPDVAEPTKEDPLYDITQALHDASGALIGAVGMDIAPGPGEDRTTVLARARTFLRELESRIPSKEKLFETH